VSAPDSTLGPVTAARNSVEDDRRLRVGRPGVWTAVVSDRSVSVGVGVRGEPGYLRHGIEAGLGTVRRSTGGTGVLHLPGDLLWSVVLPRSDPHVGRDYARAYGRLGSGVVRFLALRGIDARWSAAPGIVDDYCVLSARGEVLTVGAQILGGAAQHATATALLHHGMIARRVDPGLLRTVFGVPAREARERLTGTEELGMTDAPELLARALASALAAEFLPRTSAGGVRPMRP
jgi:lipoate-protein ligase A